MSEEAEAYAAALDALPSSPMLTAQPIVGQLRYLKRVVEDGIVDLNSDKPEQIERGLSETIALATALETVGDTIEQEQLGTLTEAIHGLWASAMEAISAVATLEGSVILLAEAGTAPCPIPDAANLEIIITDDAEFEIAVGNPDELGPFINNELVKTPHKLAVALAYLIKKLADDRDIAASDFAKEDLKNMAGRRKQLKGIIRLIWRIFFRIGGVQRKATATSNSFYLKTPSFVDTVEGPGFYWPVIALEVTAIDSGAEESDSQYVKARQAVLDDPGSVDRRPANVIYGYLKPYLSVNQLYVDKKSTLKFDDEFYPSDGNWKDFANSFADLPIAGLMILLHVLGNSNLVGNMRDVEGKKVKKTRDVSAIFRYAQYLLAVNEVWYWGDIFRGQTDLMKTMSTVPDAFDKTVFAVDSDPFTKVEERLEEPQGVLDLADFAEGDSLDEELDAAVVILEEQPVEGEAVGASLDAEEEDDWATDW